MNDDFEYLRDLLRHLRQISGAFEGNQEFIDRLQVYRDAGWPFGQEMDAFLIWVEFGTETTVN